MHASEAREIMKAAQEQHNEKRKSEIIIDLNNQIKIAAGTRQDCIETHYGEGEKSIYEGRVKIYFLNEGYKITIYPPDDTEPYGHYYTMIISWKETE